VGRRGGEETHNIKKKELNIFRKGQEKNLVVFDNARPNNKHKKLLNVKKYMIQLL